MDELPGAEQRQAQHHHGAEGDEEDVVSGPALDLGKGVRLVEAEADAKSPRIGPEPRETHDPLDAVNINQVGCETVAILPLITNANQFLTDKSVIVRIAGKVGAVAIGDGQRVSRRNTRARDVVR